MLDSTDPAQVRSIDERIDYRRTLFIVASKSGTTLEPDLFLRYFRARARTELGADAAASFVAITDPGSQLDQLARAERFGHVFHGIPSIGGRFSALSNFGLVPAAVMGLDVRRLLERAAGMRAACEPGVPLRENPGATLGLTLGAAAAAGRDKVTFVISPAYGPLGAWLEQLLAESTGKNGVALIPVEGEDVGPPEVYGDDRLFVYIRDRVAPDPEQDAAVARLEGAGQPVIRLSLRDPYDLAAEFYRWEFATAVAGAAMGINPFDQPDVEASKVETRRLTAAYETEGALAAEHPLLRVDGISVYADSGNAAALPGSSAGTDRWRACWQAIARASDRGTTWRCWPTWRCPKRTAARSSAYAITSATSTARRRPSASGRGSCIRPARPTRAARTPGCSFKSPATMRRTCRYPAAGAASAWSRRRRRAATARCCRTAAGGCCGCT